jgi:hypothetical protein
VANPEKKIISKLTALTSHFHGIGERTGGAVHGHGQHVHDAANKFDEEEKKLAAEAEKSVGSEAKKLESQGAQEAEAAARASTAAAAVRGRAEAEQKLRIDDLRTQGHGPQRHLDPDDATLQRRLGTTEYNTDGTVKLKQGGPNINHVSSKDWIDPETGTTTDAETGGPHRCGAVATRFDDPADMVKVDDYVRKYIAQHGTPPGDIPIKDVLGEDGHKRLTGFYKDPSDPSKFLPVDFEGGNITPVYKHVDGKWIARTIFPSPRYLRHP